MSEHPIRWVSRDSDPPEVRARLAQLDSYVQDRNGSIQARIAPHAASIERQLRSIEYSNQSMRSKLRELWAIATFVGTLTEGSVACKRGCSHCCHCPVMITKEEAESVGQAIGRKPSSAPPRLSSDHIEWGYHNPCPFLGSDGACSIYESRPLECRLMWNVDVDDLLCQLRPPGGTRMPILDLRNIAATWVRAQWRAGIDVHFADIREWFPRQEESSR